MIKLEEIEIIGNGKTINYYIKLGYDIKCHEKCLIKFKDLITTSAIKVDCYCDICESLNNIQYFNYIGNISRNGIYRCNECSKVIRNNRIRDMHKDKVRSEEIISKTKRTVLERYGVNSVMQFEPFKEKSKIFCMLKYGFSSPMKSQEVKDIQKKSILDKYGVNHYSKTDEYKEKYKSTCLEKYGVDNVFKSEIIKDKIKLTCLEKYGVDNPTKNKDIFDKAQRHSYKIRKHNDVDISYQGTYELDFINFCISNDIIFEKGPLIDYVLEDKNRVYHSDFYIPSINLICEIKSCWTYEKEYDENISKMEYSKMFGYNFLFIIDKEYSELKEYFII